MAVTVLTDDHSSCFRRGFGEVLSRAPRLLTHAGASVRAKNRESCTNSGMPRGAVLDPAQFGLLLAGGCR